MDTVLIISTALEVMKILLLFCMCHFAMGLTHRYKTAFFYIYIYSFSHDAQTRVDTQINLAGFFR